MWIMLLLKLASWSSQLGQAINMEDKYKSRVYLKLVDNVYLEIWYNFDYILYQMESTMVIRISTKCHPLGIYILKKAKQN